jgi:hypothetical protein
VHILREFFQVDVTLIANRSRASEAGYLETKYCPGAIALLSPKNNCVSDVYPLCLIIVIRYVHVLAAIVEYLSEIR